MLVRAAVFKSANALIGWWLQKAADRADAGYQPQAGQTRKGRETTGVQGIFGCFQLVRDYCYCAGKAQGHHPADAALGLEVGYTPALAKLICLEGADEPTYLKAERHLEQTGGIAVAARQIQRVVQRVGRPAGASRHHFGVRRRESAGVGRQVQGQRLTARVRPPLWLRSGGGRLTAPPPPLRRRGGSHRSETVNGTVKQQQQ